MDERVRKRFDEMVELGRKVLATRTAERNEAAN